MIDVLTRTNGLTQEDIRELQEQRDYPSVSILLPVYAASPDNRQQTPIRVKNLVRDAEDRLLKEFARRDLEALLERLHGLAADVDYNHSAFGLALFASASYARSFSLPFPVEERVCINHTFATRDLVLARHRSPRYHVLSLTEKAAHFYDGVRDHLREVEDFGFPVWRDREGVETELPGSFGIEYTSLHDKEEREYFNRVEHALESVQYHDPVPLALVGVERTLVYFDEVTAHKGKPKFNVVARLHGNFEKLPQRELESKIWPLVEQGMKAGLERVKMRLEDAAGGNRKATGLREVWKAAHEGRVDTLLVEENYHQAARAQDTGLHLMEAPEGNGALEDAVDDTIEQVLGTKGEVYFFAPGGLAHCERIAAILRY